MHIGWKAVCLQNPDIPLLFFSFSPPPPPSAFQLLLPLPNLSDVAEEVNVDIKNDTWVNSPKIGSLQCYIFGWSGKEPVQAAVNSKQCGDHHPCPHGCWQPQVQDDGRELQICPRTQQCHLEYQVLPCKCRRMERRVLQYEVAREGFRSDMEVEWDPVLSFRYCCMFDFDGSQ